MPTGQGDRSGSEPVAGQFESGLRAHEQLRFDCVEDSDCAVKNVGNCCGHYPTCVHVDSPTDPAAVAAECAQRDLAGICGYPVIETCICVANRCQDVAGRDAETLK
jgi:hypothetical protein